jgi:hypothetical protein
MLLRGTRVRVRVMVLNATFNNISVRSVLFRGRRIYADLKYEYIFENKILKTVYNTHILGNKAEYQCFKLEQIAQ